MVQPYWRGRVMVNCTAISTSPSGTLLRSPESEAKGRVWFLVGRFVDDDPIRNIPLQSMPIVIGRRQDASLCIASHKISSLHAQLSEVESELVLRDLGSTNGTFVNGKRVEGEVILREDDLIQFADVALRLLREDATS